MAADIRDWQMKLQSGQTLLVVLCLIALLFALTWHVWQQVLLTQLQVRHLQGNITCTQSAHNL